MKKFLILLLVVAFCVVSSNAFALSDYDDADWAGEYALNSLSVAPIGTVDWLVGAAELEVGSSYTVDFDLTYTDDHPESGGGTQAFTYNLTSSLTIGSTTWSQTVAASDITYEDDTSTGEWTDEVDTANYFFSLDIAITEPMLSESIANLAFAGTGAEGGTASFNSDYDINVSEPVPEPATMLLLGTGLVGLAAMGRKKVFKKS